MRTPLLLAALACLGLAPAAAPASASYDAATESRVEALLKRMTRAEKAALTAGEDNMNTRAIPRLGIPALRMSDGPNGVRWGKSTAFPTGIALAASFDPELARQEGQALAGELKGRGRQVLLGPCINIARHPFGGRNFESYGEDPWLAGRIAVGWIQGLQSQGVAASVKHLAANNQETLRMSVDARVDERVLREIYLPAFEAAVKEGGSLTVMAAYNRLNGEYCSAHPWLLGTLLKQEWGFPGLVVSDWGAVHAGPGALAAGMDLEMPGPGEHMGPRLAAAAVSDEQLDEAARRILRVLVKVGAFEQAPREDERLVNTPAAQALARKVAEQGSVLLKNEGAALPLAGPDIKRIAVIGPSAAKLRFGGGGSSEIAPPYAVSPLEGLRQRYLGRAEIIYAEGASLGEELEPIPASALSAFQAEYFGNAELQGPAGLAREEAKLDHDWGRGAPGRGLPADRFSARWKGEFTSPLTGELRLGLRGDDGYRLKVDGQLLLENWSDHAATASSAPLRVVQGRSYRLEIEYYENTGDASLSLGWAPPKDELAPALEAARKADAAVVFTGLSAQFESEGADRSSFGLPGPQVELIRAVAKANPRTAVVIFAGSPVDLEPFVGEVPAILQAWYPGMEGGRAMAALLSGDVNPSGKLPVSFPRRLADAPSAANFPGDGREVRYAEGLFVGYRHYDSRKVEPRYPFGHGLSYTRFEYAGLKVSQEGRSAVLRFTLRNAGSRRGAEVVQAYVAPPRGRLPRPLQELKAFAKLELDPGESRDVELRLGARAFQCWDPARKGWIAEAGRYRLRVGSSSRDLRLEGSLELKQPLL